MLPKASWISVALFALTSAALFGFLGCSATRTIPAATAQTRILAPSVHAQQARRQAGLAPIPQSKLPAANMKSAKMNLARVKSAQVKVKNRPPYKPTTNVQGATLISGR